MKESKTNQEQILKKFSTLCDFLKPLNYDGIELSLLELENVDMKEFNEIKESYDLEIPALGTGRTYLRFGYPCYFYIIKL